MRCNIVGGDVAMSVASTQNDLIGSNFDEVLFV